jgi:sorting nexin-7/30/sorting nexin-8
MEDDLSEKQAFLRENILEKGYDAEDFMKLLQSKKGDVGLDLVSWTMEELREAVKEFTKENSGIETNDNKNGEDLNKEEDNEQNEEVYDLDKFSKDHPEITGIKEEYGKCAITEFTQFSDKNDITVKLSNPEKVSGGIFSKSFISYTVETQPFNFKTKKRYSDFLWLRNTLSLMYSNCVIPPLCKKNYVDRFSETLINKRMRSIEKFMNGLLIHPLIKNSQILFDFLSVQNEADFNKKKKKYGKITAPTHIGEIKTLEGDIKISVSKEKEMYLKNIQDNSYINEDLLQKITKAYKALMVLMSDTCDKMKEISNLWKLVYEKSVKFLDVHNTSQTYDILSKVMSSWAETEKQQIEILNVNVREYFRYIKNEYHSMHDMGEVVDSNQAIYKKAYDKLENTKENLFKQQDLTQWGLSQADLENKMALLGNKDYAFSKMLPKDTKRVNMFKAFYGAYLNSIIGEYERLRFLNAKRHKDNINIYIRKLSDCITDFHVSLADRLTEFSEMKEEDNTQPVQLDKNEIIEEQEQKDLNNNNNA